MVNKAYLMSIYGVFKYLEFISALLAWIFFLASSTGRTPPHYQKWDEFFFFTHLASSLILPTVFILTLFAKKLWCLWNLTVMLVHLTLAVCGLVTSSYWAKQAEDVLEINRDKNWQVLEVSVVFGFISSILLMVDFILSFRKVRGYSDVSHTDCIKQSREDRLLDSPQSLETSEWRITDSAECSERQ